MHDAPSSHVLDAAYAPGGRPAGHSPAQGGRPFLPWRRYPVLWLLFAGCVVLAGICWLSVAAIARYREQEALSAAMAREQAVAADCSRFAARVLRMADVLHGMGAHWLALSGIARDDAMAELTWAMRHTVEAGRGIILNATIFGPDGGLRWSSEPRAPDTGIGRDYFDVHAAPGSPRFIGAPIILRPSGRAAIPVSIRVEDETGVPRGVVVVTVSASAIANGLAQIASLPGEFAAIYAADGTLLARSQGMAELLGHHALPAGLVQRVAETPLGENRRPGVVSRRDEVVAWRPLETLDHFVVAGRQTDDALRETRQLNHTLNLGAVVFTCLMAAGLRIGVAECRRRAVTREAETQGAALARLEAIHAAMPVGVFVAAWRAGEPLRVLHQGGNRDLMPDHVLFAVEAEALEEQGFFDNLSRRGHAMLEREMLAAGGTGRTCRLSARTMDVMADGTMLLCGVVLDITAEREAMARLEGTKQLAQLGEFALGLAHELKQPLQIITLGADRAQMQAATLTREQISTAFDGIIEQAMRASRVIENLRRFARGDGEVLAPVPVALADALETSLDLVRGALVEASVELSVAFGDPSPIVLAHRSALEQVFVNLLLNARDALAARRPDLPRRIIVSARVEAGSVVITVADTGGGIAPAIMPRLFRPFATTKDPDRGMGLGLSICRGLVMAMGGEITAANGPEGAVMRVRLSAAPEVGRCATAA